VFYTTCYHVLVDLILEKMMKLTIKFSFLLVVGCNMCEYHVTKLLRNYEGWNFNSGNYLFTTDTK